jgi:uncharacterized repeat protein (TIGR01451 family)
MKLRFTLAFVILSFLFPGNSTLYQSGPDPVDAPSTIQAPVLKWQRGGCYSSWCETGWYSSPAVADLDGDGAPEVVGSPYTIFVLDGATGAVKWRMASGHDRSQPSASSVGRTWPGIVLADVDGDGSLEIVTAHSGGYVSVYDHLGYFKPGWPQRPTTSELRGLSVADLDNDGTLEIIVTAAIGSQTNTWVYEHNGALRPGWPQLSNDTGYAWGVYNANASAGDLDGDGASEIVVPSDVHYVCAYESNGIQLPANNMYGNDKAFGKVGVWESLAIELRGWGSCTGDARAERYRPNFADGASLITDVNSDGVKEAVVVGNVYDCIDGYPSKYNGPFIFNADRSRFNASGFDWSSTPMDTGAPLSQDYNVIESNEPNPVAVDLDGDGTLEILYASYDGRMHAFWLDKTEHGAWPYSVYSPAEGTFRFASEPTVADLDNDGHAEVIFTSWTQKGSNKTGKLHILDYMGHVLQEVSLPASFGGNWNGALPAPTLADIDNDLDLEVVLNSASSGLVAYDLPGTANARVLWRTGRGNYWRSGSPMGMLDGSTMSVSQLISGPGATLDYTITLNNPGPPLTGLILQNALPPELTYAGGLAASAGTANYAGGVVTWKGNALPGVPVTIYYRATIDPALTGAHAIVNIAVIDDQLGDTWQIQAHTFANGYALYLPLENK